MSDIVSDRCRFSVDELSVFPLYMEEEEDELHFVIQNSVYYDLRVKYLHPLDSPQTEEICQNVLATKDHSNTEALKRHLVIATYKSLNRLILSCYNDLEFVKSI